MTNTTGTRTIHEGENIQLRRRPRTVTALVWRRLRRSLPAMVALVGIVASMALPSFRHSMLKAKESVLAEDLWTLRDLIRLRVVTWTRGWAR